MIHLRAAILTAYDVEWSKTDWGRTAFRYATDFLDFRGGGNQTGADICLKDVTTQDLDAWLATYPAASPATQNRRLASISKVYTVARQRGYAGPVPYFPRKKEAQHRTRFLSRDEQSRLEQEMLRQRLSSWYAVVILLDTGLRLAELKRLRVADINLETNMLMVPLAKGGFSRSVPMSQRVQSILYDPKLDAQLGGPAFRKDWEIARTNMGLTNDPQFVPHILRHTCASRLVQSGVPLKVIQEWLGHSDIAMTMRYAHLAPTNLADALTSLEKFNET